MGRWLIAVVAISVICISGLIWYGFSLKEELDTLTVDLTLANSKIALQETKIETDNEVLSKLKHDNAILSEERTKLNKALDSLMQKPENKKWGCSNLPDDIILFLGNLKCNR